MVGPEDFVPTSWKDEIIASVYTGYEAALRENNAVDFDDLLVLAVKLLDRSPEIVERYRARFPFILVDEYQDTNHVQYQLLRKLAGENANLHATGDPDQSIYSWRGADYRNIMDFQKDYPGAALVRLEQNYRSTGNILEAANQLIHHNPHRIEKDLYTENPEGDKLLYAALQSDAMEAAWIAEEISKLKRDNQPYNEIAVFYRTNAQSRPIEEAFMRAGIPYQLIGGIRFYERREVKDLLAHLKIRVNSRDFVSLRRIANCRATGVGDKTLEKIAIAAEQENMPVFEFLASEEFSRKFKANKKTQEFAKWCRGLAAIDISRADTAVKDILAHSGLIEELFASAEKDEAADNRIDNLHSLGSRAADFVKLRQELASQPDTVEIDADIADAESLATPTAYDLPAFLEDVALVADVDNLDDSVEKATLMTLHSAKGLEFPYVFVSGLEEGVLPHRNCSDGKAIEEERRLFYVGLTRAEKRAWLSRCEWRYTYGQSNYAPPSRFLEELPFSIIEKEDYADPVSTEYGGGFTPTYGKKKVQASSLDDLWDADPFVDDADDMGDIDFDPGMDFTDDLEMEPAAQIQKTPTFMGQRKNSSLGRLAGASQFAASPFRSGDLVRHPTYGSGKVLSVDRNKILVQFFASGTRLLLLDLCQLTKE